eukprot:scaffold4496_cov128-Isochrysis_galbana.AAC.3
MRGAGRKSEASRRRRSAGPCQVKLSRQSTRGSKSAGFPDEKGSTRSVEPPSTTIASRPVAGHARNAVDVCSERQHGTDPSVATRSHRRLSTSRTCGRTLDPTAPCLRRRPPPWSRGRRRRTCGATWLSVRRHTRRARAIERPSRLPRKRRGRAAGAVLQKRGARLGGAPARPPPHTVRHRSRPRARARRATGADPPAAAASPGAGLSTKRAGVDGGAAPSPRRLDARSFRVGTPPTDDRDQLPHAGRGVPGGSNAVQPVFKAVRDAISQAVGVDEIIACARSAEETAVEARVVRRRRPGGPVDLHQREPKQLFAEHAIQQQGGAQSGMACAARGGEAHSSGSSFSINTDGAFAGPLRGGGLGAGPPAATAACSGTIFAKPFPRGSRWLVFSRTCYPPRGRPRLVREHRTNDLMRRMTLPKGEQGYDGI